MKIRTDFVTNSSSSSFTILIGLKLTDGRSLCFQAEGGVPEGSATYFYGEAIAGVSPKQLGAAKSVEELLTLLSEGIYDGLTNKRIFKKYVQQKENTSSGGTESKKKNCVIRNPRDFIATIRGSVSDMEQIEKITIGGYESNYADYNRVYTYDLKSGAYIGLEEGQRITDIDGSHGGDLNFRDLYRCKIKQVKEATSYASDWNNYKDESLIEATLDDFVVKDGIFEKYQGTAGTVVLSEDITAIDKFAFKSCKDIVSITIPNSVVSIGENAFSGCTFLRSVSLSNSITNIEAHVFANCVSLININIPDGVTNIGEKAFYWCADLANIVIPNSVTSIGDKAFSGCENLKSITIPASVVSIGKDAFFNCSGLVDIVVDGNNAFFSSQDGVLFNKSGTELLHYPVGKPATAYSIPKGTIRIVDNAFTNGKTLRNITIPDSVSSIGKGAFENCSSLTSISIPNGVTSISEYMFKNCASLTSVFIPASVTSIEKRAFSSCFKLINVNIPNDVISIGDLAFFCCKSLTGIDIPNGVTCVEKETFYGCENLISVNISNSVTRIGEGAFWGCKSLKDITIPEGTTIIGRYAFKDCESLTRINIPNGVTSIREDTFSYCKSLTDINIPDSVTQIGFSSFSGCESLTTINIPNSVTWIGDWAFFGCKTLTRVNIPDGVIRIEDGSFSGCESLSDINIPNNVTDICCKAFTGCKNLTSIKIPNSVTHIDISTFSRCSALEMVYFQSETQKERFKDCFGTAKLIVENRPSTSNEEKTSNVPTMTGSSTLFENGEKLYFLIRTNFQKNIPYEMIFKFPGEISLNFESKSNFYDWKECNRADSEEENIDGISSVINFSCNFFSKGEFVGGLYDALVAFYPKSSDDMILKLYTDITNLMENDSATAIVLAGVSQEENCWHCNWLSFDYIHLTTKQGKEKFFVDKSSALEKAKKLMQEIADGYGDDL